MNAWAEDESASAHKLLSDNREVYIAQSAGVAFGVLPERLTDLLTLAREIRFGMRGEA